MKTTAPNSENLEVRSEKRHQDSSFSIPNSHFSPHPPALVPKLRFPEFRGAEGWESRSLGNLCEVITKGSTPTSYRFDFVDSGIRFVKIESLSGGLVDCSRTTFITEDCHTSFFRSQLKENDILFSIAGALGVIALVDRNILPANVNQAVAIVRLKHGYSHRFLLHQLQGNLIQAEVQRIRAGAAQPNISLSQLGGFLALLPDEGEQQKIAECLSSVDELIAAQARKVDALKTHKKGLMQQLFPREGETQPRLRFPEFRNEGELQKTTIGDLEPFVTSGSRGWAAFYADQGELFVRITNLWRDSIYLDLTDSKFVQLPPGANEGVRTQLKEHDVLISITADIGIIGYVDESVPSPAYINQHIALVRFDERQLCGKYVAYFLASQESQRVFRASTDNGAKAGMNLIGIQKIGLMLPSLPEQQRIASYLSSLDALITAETQKHEGIKTHKKGLMQQLFPSPEEVES